MPQAKKKMIIPRALTIAGSDSGGGAGIQADLKTFEALGVHGMSAITAITAQNTKEVTRIFNVPKEMVISQIEAVRSDIGFDAVKTGMLDNEEIITAVAEYFAKQRGIAKIVVDPVMVSKSGAILLQENALNALIEKLLPLSFIVTPNAEEAKVLIGAKRRILSLDEAVDAAHKISEYGPKVVIIKGGHLARSKTKKAIDVVYRKGKVWYLESEWYDTKNTHGTGCVFSAAIAAELAKGYDIEKSVAEAKKFVADAIRFGLGVGKGNGPVNPIGSLLQRAEKIQVVQELSRAVESLINADGIENLIPESRTNFVASGAYSEAIADVAAVPGRITNVFGKPTAVGGIAFGGSNHMARFLLGARKFDRSIRSAINLRYSKESAAVLRSMGLSCSSFKREEEPNETRLQEGHTMDWAVAHVERKMGGKLPDAVIDLGGQGKEQMILLLGKSPEELAGRVAKIAARLQKANQPSS